MEEGRGHQRRGEAREPAKTQTLTEGILWRNFKAIYETLQTAPSATYF